MRCQLVSPDTGESTPHCIVNRDGSLEKDAVALRIDEDKQTIKHIHDAIDAIHKRMETRAANNEQNCACCSPSLVPKTCEDPGPDGLLCGVCESNSQDELLGSEPKNDLAGYAHGSI